MKQKGKHPEKALSAVRVRGALERGRYADGNGLYLIVDPSGARRWVLRTVVQGKRRDLGLGSYQLVSLAEARESASQLRRIAEFDGHASRVEAERQAYECCIVEWLNRNPEITIPRAMRRVPTGGSS